jgi:hypothetical protein
MKGTSERDVGTQGRDAPRSTKRELLMYSMASCSPWMKRHESTCVASGWAMGEEPVWFSSSAWSSIHT